MAKQIPNADLFVVQVAPKDREEVSKRLKSIGAVEDLGGEEDTLLLRLKKTRSQGKTRSQPQAQAQTQWQRLTELVGTSASVQPVLSDETGHQHYPTGELTVRFLKKPTAADMKKFATKYGLRVRDRNEFVPEQVAFQLTDPATYLPDLIQQISSDEAIKNAWANTRSRYKRMS